MKLSSVPLAKDEEIYKYIETISKKRFEFKKEFGSYFKPTFLGEHYVIIQRPNHGFTDTRHSSIEMRTTLMDVIHCHFAKGDFTNLDTLYKDLIQYRDNNEEIFWQMKQLKSILIRPDFVDGWDDPEIDFDQNAYQMFSWMYPVGEYTNLVVDEIDAADGEGGTNPLYNKILELLKV